MRPLTLRESALIALMLLLLAGVGGMLGLQKLEAHYAQEQARLALLQQQLETVTALEKEWWMLNRQPSLPTLPQSLNAFMENVARRFQISDQLQLSPIPNPPSGMEGLRVRWERLNLDQMFGILFFLENHQPVLLIEQLEILTLPRSDLIRLSFRIYKQTPT